MQVCGAGGSMLGLRGDSKEVKVCCEHGDEESESSCCEEDAGEGEGWWHARNAMVTRETTSKKGMVTGPMYT